jgi:tetratricopeptide (TPR) repeat protein
VGGGFYLTTSQFGPNFYIGNNPGADGTYASIRFGRGAPEFERQDATDVAQQALQRTLSPAEVSAYWTGRALAFIRAEPVAWLGLLGRKVALLANASEMLDTESQESYAEWSAPLRVLGAVGHFGVLVPLALFGVIVTWPSRERLWVVYGMLAAYAGSVVLFYVFARYRYPLVPFLLLFGAAGVMALPRFLAAASAGRRALVGAAVLAAAVAANWPLLSPDLMRAITENNLATALQADGRLDEAITHYRRALTLQGDYAPAYNNMGTALRAQGRTEEAVAAYQRALDLQPSYPDARFNLANASLAQGNAGDAVAQYRQALQRMPDSVEAHTNLGIALQDRGDTTAAIAEFREALRLSPTLSRSHRDLGNALANAGDMAGALEELQRAAQMDPADPKTRFDLGGVLLERGRFAEAAREFTASLESEPDSAQALNNLGIALASQGKLQEALAMFDRALQVRPGFADAQVNRDRARQALAGAPRPR